MRAGVSSVHCLQFVTMNFARLSKNTVMDRQFQTSIGALLITQYFATWTGVKSFLRGSEHNDNTSF